jgi:hypothetical protein
MERLHLVFLAAFALVLAVPAIPEAAVPKEPKEAIAIRQTLSQRFPKITVVDIQPSPIPSLYEVFT